MLNRLLNPRSTMGRLLYISIIGYLILGLSGCATPPRPERPPTSVARAMQTRSFTGDLITVLKASINSLQDMDYTIQVLNSDVGLITASRTTENKKASLANEALEESMPSGQQACLAIGAVAVIAVLASIIFDGDGGSSSKSTRDRIILGGGDNDDSPDGPLVYRYKVTINLTELKNGETNVRVSASGEIEQDAKILSTGGVHESEFFQKFFAGMNQGLFLDQNTPVQN